MDPALLPLLNAHNDSELQQVIDHLLSEADAIVKDVVGYRFGVFFNRASGRSPGDAEDVRSEVLADVIACLRRFVADPNGIKILQFRNYVAAMSHRACHDFLRKKYPQRAKLKNRIRYLLLHVPDFGIWEVEGDWLCGMNSWKGQSQSAPAQGIAVNRDRPFSMRASDLGRIVREIFEQAESPIKLDDLVEAVAQVTGTTDQAMSSVDISESVDLLDKVADPRANTAADVERRIFLTRLWDEIRELPIRQRTVLLMNLRDEDQRGVVQLFPLTGVASIRQIADTLLVPHDEFAEIWNDLPLDDESIAARMGATRQQVINLRKSARERLERRLKEFL